MIIYTTKKITLQINTAPVDMWRAKPLISKFSIDFIVYLLYIILWSHTLRLPTMHTMSGNNWKKTHMVVGN